MTRVTVVILSLSLLLVGCGKTYKPKSPEEAAAYSHGVSVRVLNILKDAGALASDIRKTEQTLHTAGTISEAQHAAFEGRRCDPGAPPNCVEKGFLKLQHAADNAIDAISKTDLQVDQIAGYLRQLMSAAQEVSTFNANGKLSFALLLSVITSALALIGA